MLKSYEAIIANGHVKWLAEQPDIKSARVIVTILEETTLSPKRRIPPASIAGKGKTLGDIVSSIIPEEDWEFPRLRDSPYRPLLAEIDYALWASA